MLEQIVKRSLQIVFTMMLVLNIGSCSKAKTDAAVAVATIEPMATAGSMAAAEAKQTETKQSQVRIGGAIAVTTKILTDVVVGQPVVVEIVFTVRPHEQVVVEVMPNDHYQLDGDYRSVVHANEHGIANLHIALTPFYAGKQYLKMMAFCRNGEVGRPVAVALPVVDGSGHVPEQEKEIKDRVEFETLPVN